MEVQLYLNKTIRITGVLIAAYDSKSIRLMVVMRGNGLNSQILLSGPNDFADFP